MSTIGSLQVNIIASTDKFIKGLHNARGHLQKFAGTASLIGGSILGGLGASLKWFESVGSELHDLSVATGLSVEQLDFLKYASEQSGASLQNVTKAIRELQDHGISAERFEELATNIAKIKDPTLRAQQAFAFFGKKAGAALLPMLGDLPELRKRFEQLGGSFTGEMADSADALGDSLGNLKLSIRNTVFALVRDFAPAIKDAIEWMADTVRVIGQWIKEHKTLVKWVGLGVIAIASLAALAAPVGILAGAFVSLGNAFLFASANPIVLTIAAITAGVIALYAAIYKLNSMWDEYDKKIEKNPLAKSVSSGGRAAFDPLGTASDVLFNRGNAKVFGGPKSDQAVTMPDSASSENTAKNTAETNGLLTQLIALMGGKDTGTTPVQLSVAGVP